DENVHAFAATTKELAEQLANGNVYFGYEKPVNDQGIHHFSGYITKELLAKKVSIDAICYVCGPVPFLKNVVNMLADLGIPEENIRFEFFGPAIQLERPLQVQG